MNWSNILITELAFVGVVLIGLGIVKAPRFLMRRRLARGFPWGYYADQVPKKDAGYFQENNSKDFMHDVATEFGGLDTYGDFGEFSGFGELGEYGSSFFADGGSSE
jgi:hypothetical protein